MTQEVFSLHWGFMRLCWCPAGGAEVGSLTHTDNTSPFKSPCLYGSGCWRHTCSSSWSSAASQHSGVPFYWRAGNEASISNTGLRTPLPLQPATSEKPSHSWSTPRSHASPWLATEQPSPCSVWFGMDQFIRLVLRNHLHHHLVLWAGLVSSAGL